MHWRWSSRSRFIFTLAFLAGLRLMGANLVNPIVLFDGTNGNSPQSQLTQALDGNFYGTTYTGSGTFFRVTPYGKLTNLTSLASGARCFVSVVRGTNGNFFGETGSGNGTIFEVTTNGVLTTRHTFSQADGSWPTSLILGSDGSFYGTTAYGGNSYTTGDALTGYGTIFKMSHSGVFSNLYLFTYSNPGPNSLVEGNDGAFYGATASGTYGTAFKITPSGAYTKLISFNGFNGYAPQLCLKLSDGTLIGTSRYGGANFDPVYTAGAGTVFRMTPDGTVTTLTSFYGTNGLWPTRVALGADGNLYGTTECGGATYGFGPSGRGYGCVFRLTLSGSLTVLYSFTNGVDGSFPEASVTVSPDGTIFGTTSAGGLNGANAGTVFRISVPPVFTSIRPVSPNNAEAIFTVSFGQTNVIQSSSNLVSWSDITTYAGTNGSFTNSITIAPDRQFYRILLRP